ncbi:MAG: hypothetical protein KF749_03530 [Bacteroidetes bacterium]|nr:hypothetical protein [Bacteroidota bacterium]MCW5897080.1 hypothetical protein [Bacteroidota bacterium]
MNKTQRIEYLRTLVRAQTASEERRTFRITFRRENLDRVVIRVDSNFLRYRLQNGRTHRRQILYLKNHPDAPSNLFSDPESEAAQRAQELILLDMVNEKNLYKNLIDEKQKEPAIITFDGYVLNGNRRLAALRRANVQYMDCVVLPEDALPNDLYEVELDLQMAEKTELEYDWVDELLHIRYGLETLGESDITIRKTMRLEKPEFDSLYYKLLLVDQYLGWTKRSGQYDLVEYDEEAFKQLAKLLPKISDDAKREFFKRSVFALILTPPEEERLYKHIRRLYSNLDNVYTKFCESAKQKTFREDDTMKRTVDEDDPLALVASVEGSEGGASSSQFFETSDSAKEDVTDLMNVIDDVVAQETEERDRNAAYEAVSEAQRLLQGLTIDSLTTDQAAIKSKLTEIIRKSKELLSSIEKTKTE